MLVSAPTLLLAALSCTTDATLRTFCTPMALSNVAGHHEQALARAADVHKLLNSSIFMHDAGRFCSPVSKAHHPWRLWWWIKSRPATPNVAFWPDRTPNSPQFHLQNPQWTPTTSGGHALSMDLFVPSTPFARSFPPVRRCLLRLTWLQRVAQPVSRPQYPLFHLSTQELAVHTDNQWWAYTQYHVGKSLQCWWTLPSCVTRRSVQLRALARYLSLCAHKDT